MNLKILTMIPFLTRFLSLRFMETKHAKALLKLGRDYRSCTLTSSRRKRNPRLFLLSPSASTLPKILGSNFAKKVWRLALKALLPWLPTSNKISTGLGLATRRRWRPRSGSRWSRLRNRTRRRSSPILGASQLQLQVHQSRRSSRPPLPSLLFSFGAVTFCRFGDNRPLGSLGTILL